MNDTVLEYWNLVLTENIVLFYFLGVLLAMVEADRMRTSLLKGFRFALLLLCAGVAGGLLGLVLGGGFFHLLAPAYTLIALAAAGILTRIGELDSMWRGMPAWIRILVPCIGLQWLVYEGSSDPIQVLIRASAGSLGFYLVFVMVAVLREQQLLAEARETYRGPAALLVGIGLLALATAGFLTWG